MHKARSNSTIKNTLVYTFRVGGRKNNDSARIKAWHLSTFIEPKRNRNTHLDSRYHQPPCISLYYGVFQPLPSFLLSSGRVGHTSGRAALDQSQCVLTWFSANIKFPRCEPDVGTCSALCSRPLSLKWLANPWHHDLGLCSLWKLLIILCHAKMLPHRLFSRERCWSSTEIWRPSQARMNYDIKSPLERDQANGWLCKAFDPLQLCRPLELNEVKAPSWLL